MFQPTIDVPVTSISLPTSDGLAGLFSSSVLPGQSAIKNSEDPLGEDTEIHGRTKIQFETKSSPTTAASNSSPSVAQPILIPITPARWRDPDWVPTPVSGRGDRKGHLFPVKASSPTRLSHFATGQEDSSQTVPSPRFDHTCHHRPVSLSVSPRSRSFASTMHTDRAGSRYTPTSPLSPRLGSTARPISPQPRKQGSRPMNIPIPKYHPLHFQPPINKPAEASSLSAYHPVVNYTRHSSTTESPRRMKEWQRELIDRAKMSSNIAAAPHAVKPNAPRLDPLGSPKGPVTPLALEEGSDYFLFAGSGETSPLGHPGSRAAGSVKGVCDGTNEPQNDNNLL